MNQSGGEVNIPKDILSLLQSSEKEKLSGNHEKAIKIAEQALVKNPMCVEALEEVADNYLALNDIEKARKAASFILELDEKSYTALYIMGFILSRDEEFNEAVTFLENANAIDANNPEILRSLGWAYSMDKKLAKGIVILERALNLRSNDSMILCDLGVCYLKDNKSNKALDLFYRALEENPQDMRIHECIRLAEEMKKIV